VGEQILDKDFVKQSQLKEHVQNNLEQNIYKIVLGEGQLVQKKPRICNFPSAGKNHFL
jgi:hypothetical protein